MNFKTIEYLKNGNPKQQRAYGVFTKYAVMEHLSPYEPVLAGTIPIAIDVDNSDLDIICYWEDAKQFRTTLTNCFSDYAGYKLSESEVRGQYTVIASFMLAGFEVEVFGQNTPSHEQLAYRHMLIENYLLNMMGGEFRENIRRLKLEGLKTEPAFAQALGLQGDPYLELLKYEKEMAELPQ
ncbi:DUF4269 domain-containing protein [Pontibacter korlensis]|uniref:Diadenosine tetraphosphate hydrolase n=1 Tax=Pontibacter korlensis TaxID=400092 RepID=A0A0E3ZI62_9BACT|nr:DUF4269 domain-containing protein [Pontibacter korlensis]AKD05199.1 hypothetical protein PKOR_21675 [Pontibacter korlensis]